MAEGCARRIVLMLLSFLVYGGTMALIVLSAFNFGKDFGIFKNTTGDVLQKYALPVTPTRLIYDYWFLLYGLQIFFHAYAFSALCRTAHADTPVPMFRLSMCPTIIFSLCIANNLAVILWLFLWDREYTVAALIVMAAAPITFYIAFYHTCRGLYMDLALLHSSKSDNEAWVVRYLVHNIIGFLAAWTTISFFYNAGVIVVNEIKIDMDITCLALLGGMLLELLIWLWVDVFFLDDYTRYTISTYFPMIIVSIALMVEWNKQSEWSRLKIAVVVATAVSLICLVIKLVFLIYRHRKRPFLKAVTVKKKTGDTEVAAEEIEEGKNGNGSATIITEEKKASVKSKSQPPEQTKAIVNELHSKFEGGSKANKAKQELVDYEETKQGSVGIEVVHEVNEEEDPTVNIDQATDVHSASTCGVQDVVVPDKTEEPVLPPVDYDQTEEPENPNQNETARVEDTIPVPQPMELTRENVQMMSESQEPYRHSEQEQGVEQNKCPVSHNLVDVDDTTNTSHASVEAQGSDDENVVDDFNEVPPPTDGGYNDVHPPADDGYNEVPPPADDLVFSQEYQGEETEQESYPPPMPEPLELPPPMQPEDARSNSCDIEAETRDDSGNGLEEPHRTDIDGTAKTLGEESEEEGSPVKFGPNDDVVEAEVHTHENGEYISSQMDYDHDLIQTDTNKMYHMPDDGSDGVYDSSDEGEVTLAG